jgi:uncharacterized protein YpuA (DUF1002 family)
MKTLSLLPNIEEWISSEKITHLIMGLNTSYKISSGIIAGLVYDLVIKKTAPENLVIELNKKINFDSKRLGVLVAEIKEKLLKPIEVPLRQDLQIDIQKIVIPVAPIQPEKAEIEKQELMQKPQQAPQKLREVPSFSSEQTT